MGDIMIPSKSKGQPAVPMKAPFRLVVVGANGSGKTRFGIAVEQKNQAHMTVHRLSAQKALSLPESAAMSSLSQAETELFYGTKGGTTGNKNESRWRNNPATTLLSDYDKLLSLLFAKEVERDRNHREDTRKAKAYLEVQDSPIDQIVAAWKDLMPQRQISFHDGKVLVQKGVPGEYHAKEMSDGERVSLYILGQVFCAPPGSLLIVDEPENHLHRALMNRLWNKVEELCPDKSFVYITHDLEFAAGRVNALKVWVKSYDGSSWEWDYVPNDPYLSEPLILEIIGNRKPLLFCEGDTGGLDHAIYQACFPGMHVMPRGGSEQVIEATKALQANKALHVFEAKGIIDRDARSDEEVVALNAKGVSVLKYAEIENLLCASSVVTAVSKYLKRNISEDVAQVTSLVRDALKSELEGQTSSRAAARIRYLLSRFSPASLTEAGVSNSLDDLKKSVDASKTLSESRALCDAALASGQLSDLLRVYNRKSIVERVSSLLKLQPREYQELILRLLHDPDGKVVLDSMRSELPELTSTQASTKAAQPDVSPVSS